MQGALDIGGLVETDPWQDVSAMCYKECGEKRKFIMEPRGGVKMTVTVEVLVSISMTSGSTSDCQVRSADTLAATVEKTVEMGWM
jgi:hypothetical protein